MDMDFENANLLEKHRLRFVESLDPGKVSLQSYLRSKSVLDDEDCQVINSGVTRQDRVGKMLDILALKGPAAIDHFLEALEFENPALYETVTGKKAEARVVPVPALSRDGIWDWTTGVDGKALIDFDRQFLAKQLNKALDDLKGMTYCQSKTLEEKSILERKLFEASDDLESKTKHMADLQEKIIHLTSESRATETENDAAERNIPLHDYLQELWKDNMERNNIIIVLQSYVMIFKEQNEQLHKANVELKAKNEEFAKEIEELQVMHDFEKRNSKRLNETMASQTEAVDSTKRELLQLKFRCSTLEEERDGLEAQLGCLKKWTEILNCSFDELENERNYLKLTQDDICGQFKRLRDHVSKKQSQNQLLEFHYERALMEKNRLEKTLECVREQRNMLYQSREEATTEKLEILKENLRLETAVQECKQKYKNDMQKHESIEHEFEKRHLELQNEMKLLEVKFADTAKELAEAKTALEGFREKKDSDSSTLNEDVPLSPSDAKEAVRSKQRKTTRNRDSLIESIRRKVKCEDVWSQMEKGNSLPAYLNGIPQIQQNGISNVLQGMSHCNLRLDLNRPSRMAKGSSASLPSTTSLPFASLMMPFSSAVSSSRPSRADDALPSTSLQHEEDGSAETPTQDDDDSTGQFRERASCMQPGQCLNKRARSTTAPPTLQ